VWRGAQRFERALAAEVEITIPSKRAAAPRAAGTPQFHRVTLLETLRRGRRCVVAVGGFAIGAEPGRVSRWPRFEVLSSGEETLRGYGTSKKYPDELVQRGIRLALESERPIAHIAADLGMHPETLRKKVRQFEADTGKRPELLASQEREEIRRLRKENYELRRANEILKSASVFFAKELDPDRPK
jgi:transposase